MSKKPAPKSATAAKADQPGVPSCVPPCPFCESTDLSAMDLPHLTREIRKASKDAAGTHAAAVVCGKCFAQGPLAVNWTKAEARITARGVWALWSKGVKPDVAIRQMIELTKALAVTARAK